MHAVNPSGYRNWATLVLPMIENTIAAARISGARVLLPERSTTMARMRSRSYVKTTATCDDA